MPAIYEARAVAVKVSGRTGRPLASGFAPKREFAQVHQGDSSCPVPRAKRFLFRAQPNHFSFRRRSAPIGGTLRGRHGRRARDAVDVLARN